MTGLLSPFIYPLPPGSSFLDLVAMAALRRRMRVLRKIRPDKPLPPVLVICSSSVTPLSFFPACVSFFSSAAVGVAGLPVVG